MIKIAGVTHPTVKDAAREFGVQPKTVQDWIARGIIPQPPRKSQGLREIQVFPPEYMADAREALESYRRARHS